VHVLCTAACDWIPAACVVESYIAGRVVLHELAHAPICTASDCSDARQFVVLRGVPRITPPADALYTATWRHHAASDTPLYTALLRTTTPLNF